MNIKMVDLYGQYLAIRDEIDRAMAEVVESSSFIKGPAVEQLEADRKITRLNSSH